VKSLFAVMDCANCGSYELVASFHLVNVSKSAAPSIPPDLPVLSPLPKAGSRPSGWLYVPTVADPPTRSCVHSSGTGTVEAVAPTGVLAVVSGALASSPLSPQPAANIATDTAPTQQRIAQRLT
jgi:hypothetical protein